MALNLNSGFEILYLSDLKYDRMTVEIKYKDRPSAQINKDKDIDRMEIEIYSEYVIPDFLSELKFPSYDFLEALSVASSALRYFNYRTCCNSIAA